MLIASLWRRKPENWQIDTWNSGNCSEWHCYRYVLCASTYSIHSYAHQCTVVIIYSMNNNCIPTYPATAVHRIGRKITSKMISLCSLSVKLPENVCCSCSRLQMFVSDNLQESRAIARKPRDAACFPTPNDCFIVICLSLRKVKAVIIPAGAVICRLKADWMWN